jgi:hypothetical protein
MGHKPNNPGDTNKSNKQKLADRTPEQIISGIRNNLNSNLAVTGDDTRLLLAQYDLAHVEIERLLVDVGRLMEFDVPLVAKEPSDVV